MTDICPGENELIGSSYACHLFDAKPSRTNADMLPIRQSKYENFD